MLYRDHGPLVDKWGTNPLSTRQGGHSMLHFSWQPSTWVCLKMVFLPWNDHQNIGNMMITIGFWGSSPSPPSTTATTPCTLYKLFMFFSSWFLRISHHFEGFHAPPGSFKPKRSSGCVAVCKKCRMRRRPIHQPSMKISFKTWNEPRQADETMWKGIHVYTYICKYGSTSRPETKGRSTQQPWKICFECSMNEMFTWVAYVSTKEHL